MSEAVITVRNLTKGYRRYKNNHQRMQHQLLGFDVGERVEKLNDISFEVYKGETVGLLGSYGSGRTTLMQILAGIVRPDSGSFEIHGEVTPVFDLRLCFDGALSARTNLRIKCAVLGWTREMVKQKEQAMLEFTGIEEMADQPLRTLPKGTASKLGFVISTEEKPEILLYDEGFSIGGAGNDERYQNRLKSFIEGDDVTALMTVSNTNIGKLYCTRGIVLKDGGIAFDGKYADALKYYRKHIRKTGLKGKNAAAVVEIEDEFEDQMDDNADFGF